MLNIYTYNLPFNSPFRTTKGTFKYREGIILTYRSDNLEAFGEVAPLPGFSSETLDYVLSILKKESSSINEALNHLDSFHIFLNSFENKYPHPSLIFGLDTLYHDFISKIENITLSNHLFGENRTNQIKVNTTIGLTSQAKALSDITNAIIKGYETVKIKVGVDFKAELELIRSVRNSFPDLRIRIDANQAWTFDEAHENLTQLQSYSIEFCEEPLKEYQIDEWKLLANSVKIPLAVDESFRSLKDVELAAESTAVDVFILKPMLFGSFSNILNVCHQLKEASKKIVFTTSLDSIIGRTVTGILANNLGSMDLAHGLGTATFLSDDLGREIEIVDGNYKISDNPGIGRVINFNHLNVVV